MIVGRSRSKTGFQVPDETLDAPVIDASLGFAKEFVVVNMHDEGFAAKFWMCTTLAGWDFSRRGTAIGVSDAVRKVRCKSAALVQALRTWAHVVTTLRDATIGEPLRMDDRPSRKAPKTASEHSTGATLPNLVADSPERSRGDGKKPLWDTIQESVSVDEAHRLRAQVGKRVVASSQSAYDLFRTIAWDIDNFLQKRRVSKLCNEPFDRQVTMRVRLELLKEESQLFSRLQRVRRIVCLA